MSDKNTVELILNAKSESFQRGMREGEKALSGFGQFARKVGNEVQALTQKIGFLGTAATALTTGLALKKLFSITDYMPVDEALLRMRNNLKNTAEEMDSFKKQLGSLASATGMGQGETFHMASQLSLEYKPEDIAEIIKQTDRISKGIQDATPEAAKDALVQIMKLYKLTGKEAREAADNIITSQVNLESFETVIQRLAVRSGTKKDYVEQLGFIRGLGIAGINKPRSIMQLNEAMEMIDDKADMLQRSGIKVFDIDAEGNRVWREKLKVIKDLEQYLSKVKKTMSSEKFNKYLDEELGVPKAYAKLEFMFSHFKDFEAGIAEIEKAGEIAVGRVFAGEATWGTQLKKIKSSLGEIKSDLSFIYDLAKKPITFIADHKNITKAAGYTVAGVSVAALAALGYGKGKEFLKGLGKTGVGIAEGKAIEAATGVTPVFVTNMPAGGLLSGDIPGKVGGMAAIATWLKSLLPVGAAAIGLAGTAIGTAALTTGTAAYAGYNAWKGGSGENWINERLGNEPHDYLYDYFHKAENPNVKNEIKLTINIDKNGRATVDNGNKGTDVNIDLNRGAAFGE
jgi:hypothetical protein